MKRPKWVIEIEGTPYAPIVAEVSAALVPNAVREIAKVLVSYFRRRVRYEFVAGRHAAGYAETRGTVGYPVASNPTLVHHHRAVAADWHVVDDSTGSPALADLYNTPAPETARRIAQAIARAKGADVVLLDNRTRPRALAKHPRARVARNPTEPIAYGRTIGRDWVQEWYESSSGHARLRAAQLRRAGFRVSVASMGQQVTPVGRVRMTLVTAQGDVSRLPAVTVERMSNPARRTYTEAQWSTPAAMEMIRTRILGPPPHTRADVERAARYLSQTLRVGGMRASRALVVGAIQAAGQSVENPRNTGFGEVVFSRAEIVEFKRHWPTSGLPDKAVRFTFDPRRGLVAMRPQDFGTGADQAAVDALVVQALEFLRQRDYRFQPQQALDSDAYRAGVEAGRAAFAAGRLSPNANELRTWRAAWPDFIRGWDVGQFGPIENPRVARDGRGRFKHQRLEAPARFDPRSLRTIRSGRRSRVVIGCPRGQYDARRRRCRVGTRAQAVLTPNPDELERAGRTFRRWHRFDPRHARTYPRPARVPGTVVALGEIPALVYRSDKWRRGRARTYEHKTEQPRPLLCTGPDGKGLFIVGGGVHVTPRGLEG